SFTGSQSGTITNTDHANALIQDVEPYRILQELDRGNLEIVAGFQGMSVLKEITTLGRGGSDTTAVALGIALCAKEVIYYKAVLGMYKEDPKKNPSMKPISYLHYSDALGIVQKGALILHQRALLLAQKNAIPLLVTSFNEKKEFTGTVIRDVEN